ncbi:zinc finger protein 521-like [Tribolium madens]|uniref:zinc finger protein 521-like n=1 Tax=Tribolium madens TaxID=41895 RepID=UPI001CF73157|nr:zinc finger protein 521-like [Tribolium madens]XP_044272664.1 zinc finger protein 521-like [Tribolium madens]
MSGGTTHSCYVFGCTERKLKMYQFPNPRKEKDRFYAWVEATANPKLNNLPIEVIFRRGFVCKRHFEVSDFIPQTNEKLYKSSIPSKNLPKGRTNSDKDTSLPTFQSGLPSATEQTVLTPSREPIRNPAEEITPLENFRNQIDLSQTTTGNVDRHNIDFKDLIQNVNPIKITLKKALEVSTESRVESDVFNENFVQTNQCEAFDYESEYLPPRIFPSYVSIYEDINEGINEIKCSKQNQVVQVTKPYFKALKSFSLDSNAVHEVCRICFRLLREEEIVKLYDEREDIKELKYMLQFILPELDLEIYTNVVVCTKCRELLTYSCQLRQSWICTEEKLQKLVEEKKSMINSASDLVIVTDSSVGDVMTEHDRDVTTNHFDHDYEKIVEKAPEKHEVQVVTRRVLQNLPEATDSIISSHGVLRKKKVNFFYKGVNLTTTHAVIGLPRRRKGGAATWAEGPYICEMCAFSTKSLGSFQRHLRKRANEDCSMKKKPKIKAFKCDNCDQLFTSQQRLKQHFSKHQIYRCGICDKDFKLNSVLQKHIKHVHLKDYNYYQCHMCGKQFCYRNSLKAHLITHNAKTIKCDLCPKKFATRVVLKKHLRNVHSDAPPLTCHYCGKSIKFKNSLEKHIQVYHLRQGDICDICEKPLSNNKVLMKHKLIVHGVDGIS